MDEYDRRHFIRTSLPGFLGLTMALPGLTALATRANACNGRLPENQAINWDAFLEAVEKESARQHLDDWDEVSYLKKASQLCTRLNLKDEHLLKAFKNAHRGLGNGRVDFAPLEKQKDFHVTLLQFEKEEAITHHDHPEMTGVILCASGEIETWNYDLIGPPTTRTGSKNHRGMTSTRIPSPPKMVLRSFIWPRSGSRELRSLRHLFRTSAHKKTASRSWRFLLW